MTQQLLHFSVYYVEDKGRAENPEISPVNKEEASAVGDQHDHQNDKLIPKETTVNNIVAFKDELEKKGLFTNVIQKYNPDLTFFDCVDANYLDIPLIHRASQESNFRSVAASRPLIRLDIPFLFRGVLSINSKLRDVFSIPAGDFDRIVLGEIDEVWHAIGAICERILWLPPYPIPRISGFFQINADATKYELDGKRYPVTVVPVSHSHGGIHVLRRHGGS